jgi:hypothetical protein
MYYATHRLSNVLGVTFALALYLPLVSFIDQTRNSQTANFAMSSDIASRTGGSRNKEEKPSWEQF